MWHPLQVCATTRCCFCCTLDPDVTCCIIAFFSVSMNGFAGANNFGISHWALYFTSLSSFSIHLVAGVLLFLGGFWGEWRLKLAYCWLAFFGVFFALAGLVLYLALKDSRYIIWGPECHNFKEAVGTFIVVLHVVWLVIFDLYTSLVVLGNSYRENYCCEVTKADFGLPLTGSGFRSKLFIIRMEGTVEDNIKRLYAQDKWEEIVENFGRNKYLPWVWPERKNLEFIGKSVGSQNLKSVISVGCGSGLLEWLLASATGMEVVGVETDGNWWKSKYSPGVFIPMTLVEDSKRGDFGFETADSALLFCYFNNLEAFLNYMENFKGTCLIVIGPGPGRGTYIVPEPFRLPGDLEGRWKLFDYQEIRSSRDFIAVYVRN